MTPSEVGVWTGLLFTINMAIAFPLAPFWGVLAERYSRRALIVRSYLLEAVAAFLVSIAQDLSLLIVARVLMGLTFGSVAIVMAAQASFTPRKQVGAAIATVQAAQPIAASLGPPIGAFLIPLIGLPGLYRLDAILTLAAGILVAVLFQENVEPRHSESILARTREVLGWTWQTPAVRWNYIASIASRGGITVVDTYLPLRITQIAGADAATPIGVILGICGGLTMVSTWLVGRLVDRIDETRMFVRATLVATVLTAGLALAPGLWLLGALAVLRSVPVAMTSTILFTHMARALPRDKQTAVMGVGALFRRPARCCFRS